jgi:diguanylate cyclase
MKPGTWMLNKAAGEDRRMRRLIAYWSATALLYLVALAFMWVEVKFGTGTASVAALFTGLVIVGETAFFWVIRNYQRLGLTTAQLSLYQSWFAIICIALSYTGQGPLRGATLVGLFVVLIFSAFSLKAHEARSLSIFAVVFLGATMIAMPFTAPQFFDLKTELLHFMLAGSALLVVGVINGRLSDLSASLKAQREELRAAAEANRTLATTDELTSLPNRRYMTELLRCDEQRRTVLISKACIALIDLDWFKKINDVYGHDAGDEVLKQFAQLGRQQLRENDVLARWGGEEFLLYLPGTDLENAQGVLERLRHHVQSSPLLRQTESISYTFSGGLIELTADEPVEHGIRRADALLYRAKQKGRNLVETTTQA